MSLRFLFRGKHVEEKWDKVTKFLFWHFQYLVEVALV